MVAQPSTAPPFSKRPATASKSAPATRTAPCHAALTRRSGPAGPATGNAGSNQSPRPSRTRRPVAAARSPSRTTSPSISIWPGNHAEPIACSGEQNALSGCLMMLARISGLAAEIVPYWSQFWIADRRLLPRRVQRHLGLSEPSWASRLSRSPACASPGRLEPAAPDLDCAGITLVIVAAGTSLAGLTIHRCEAGTTDVRHWAGGQPRRF